MSASLRMGATGPSGYPTPCRSESSPTQRPSMTSPPKISLIPSAGPSARAWPPGRHKVTTENTTTSPTTVSNRGLQRDASCCSVTRQPRSVCSLGDTNVVQYVNFRVFILSCAHVPAGPHNGGRGARSVRVLFEGAQAMGLVLTSKEIEAFRIYQDELAKWNAQFNLTAIHGETQVQIRHFLDSLSCLIAIGQDKPDCSTGRSPKARPQIGPPFVSPSHRRRQRSRLSRHTAEDRLSQLEAHAAGGNRKESPLPRTHGRDTEAPGRAGHQRPGRDHRQRTGSPRRLRHRPRTCGGGPRRPGRIHVAILLAWRTSDRTERAGRTRRSDECRTRNPP